MRAVAAILFVLLLAGCSGGPDTAPKDAGDSTAAVAPKPPVSFDHLTDRLNPASAEVQDILAVEDAVDLPGNGTIVFATGRGMHCEGDADAVAPNATGWVACMVRLARDPTAMSQDVHDLGIGRDAQRLTLRQAAEPVEWRVTITVVDADRTSDGQQGGVRVAYDSGWRLVDLSAVLGDPIVTVDVTDPCDAPDAAEERNIGPLQRRGAAVLVVEFEASHGKPSVEVDLGPRSIPGEAESTPFAQHGTTEHGLLALYPTASATRALRLELHVDLEAPEDGAGGGASGPCGAPIGGETQEWTVTVGVMDADGAIELKTRTVDVVVILDAMPS